MKYIVINSDTIFEYGETVNIQPTGTKNIYLINGYYEIKAEEIENYFSKVKGK